MTALAFNYPTEYEDAVPSSANAKNYMDASSKDISFTLEGLRPGAMFSVETLDKEHGNVYDEYQAIGAPHSPTREQTAWLKTVAWGTKKEVLKADANGRLEVSLNLKPWTCVLMNQL